MPANCKPGPTLRKQRVILTPGARILYDTSAAWTETSAQSGKNWSSTTERCPGPWTFTSNVSSVRQPEGVGRRSRCQPCQSCASQSDSVAPLVPTGPCHPRWLLIVSSWWMLREIVASNAAIWCVSYSNAAAHAVLHKEN